MTYNRVIGRKGGSKNVDTTQVRGQPKGSIAVGPHIAIVKNNVDSTRRGKLTVWTPIFGDPEDDPTTWVQVLFASPYMSYTERKSDENLYENVRHTSGMWFPSPDIGTKVLITFPSGNKHEGVWIACLPERFNTRMIPGYASSKNWDKASDPSGEFANADGKYDEYQPVGEFIEKRQPNNPDYYQTPIDIEGQLKPINKFLARIFRRQGLNRDLIRGHTSSSGQRETPSEVFGISTKGRLSPDPKDDKKLIDKLSTLSGNSLTIKDIMTLKSKVRQPGHSFVMDDGELNGDNQLIRLRSASGHQILMHDTSGVIYIGNSTGTTWMEFSKEGKIDVYSQDSFNVRSGTMNLYADNIINMHSKGSFNMLSDGTMHIEGKKVNIKSTELGIGIDSNNVIDLNASGAINIDANGNANIKSDKEVKIDGNCVHLGNGADGASSPVGSLSTINKADTVSDSKGVWNSQNNAIFTIATRVPTHEPFSNRDNINDTQVIDAPVAPIQRFIFDPENPTDRDIPNIIVAPGPVQAKRETFINKEQRPSRSSVILQPDPNGTVGNLSKEQTKKLLATIGQNESSGKYTAVNQFGYVGKYQFGLAALEDSGYVKKGTFAAARKAGYNSQNINDVLDDPNVWTKKGGVASKSDFLSNRSEQEKAMEIYTDRNVATLRRIGVINDRTPPEEQAGLIMASHLKGPGDVKKWYINGGTFADANGTTIDKYYNLGRSSVQNVPN